MHYKIPSEQLFSKACTFLFVACIIVPSWLCNTCWDDGVMLWDIAHKEREKLHLHACSAVFSLGVFQRAQYPLDLLMCPLANAMEGKCPLWKAVKVVVFNSEGMITGRLSWINSESNELKHDMPFGCQIYADSSWTVCRPVYYITLERAPAKNIFHRISGKGRLLLH